MRRRRLIMQANVRQLAVDGGPPALAEGPPAWPLPDEYVLENLQEAYREGAWGRYHGPYVERLEQIISERHQVRFAMACASGTVAVEIALRGLGVAEGDEVLLAGYDFAGNFRAIEAVGARPVLVDLQPGSWYLDPEQVAAAAGEKTKGLIVSHLHSSIAPMRELMEIAHRRGLAVIEDACQAQGAVVEGRPAGTWGDVGVWSFGGSKLLTAGRGGAIYTDREEVFQRAKIFCERGNHAFPLSELQAAVLLPQLAKLSERNQRREEHAHRLLELTADVSLLKAPLPQAKFCRPAYYKLSWFYDEAAAGESREAFLAAARAEGIAMDEGFRGFAHRPDTRCRKVGSLRHTEEAAATTVVLHHPVLLQSESTMQRLAEGLRKIADIWGAGEDEAAE